MKPFHRGILCAALLGALLPRPAVAQFTSRFDYIALAGNYNGFNTFDQNMVLVSNGVWQGYISVQAYTNLAFLFATRNFTNVWKEVGQSPLYPPFSGVAETNGSGSDLTVTGVFSGTLRAELNEINGVFSVRDVTAGSAAGDVWINEFHYDNESNDSNEFVEVAGQAGVNLTNYVLLLYNGDNGTAYSSNVLSGTLTNQQNGFGAKHLTFAANGIQNGPDGLALMRRSPFSVLQFISYEGVFTAVSGPASGMTSVNIGVQEDGGASYTQSLQKVGTGASYNDFTWIGYTNGSPGQLNEGQFAVTGTPAVYIVISNVTQAPTSVGTGDTVHVDADITPYLGVTNLHATLFYRMNSNGLFQPLPMSRTGTHHRTINPIPANPSGGTVDYYIFATFTGVGTNSPTTYPSNAPASVLQYAVSRVPPGAVWINEVNPGDGVFDGGSTESNEYIELAGRAGFNIGGWRIELYSGPTIRNGNYMVPPGTTLGNDSSGYGFYVIGDPAVTNVDLVFTNASANNMEEPGGVKLYNEFGELQYSLCWDSEGVNPDWTNGYTWIGTDSDFWGIDSLNLWGTGDSYDDFAWDPDIQTPGAVDDNQTLINGNTNALAPILLCPSNVLLTCANATIPTANVASVTATGLCSGGSVTVTHVGDVTNSGSGCLGSPKIVTRTYRAVSACATTSECIQTITVEDQTPPTLICSTTALVNAGFEFGDFTGWTTFGGLFTNISVASLQPRSGFRHALLRGSSSSVLDDSANNLDGLYLNNPTRVQTGATTGTGYSVTFNGSNQYAEVPYTPLLNATSFSVAAWARPVSMTNRRVVVASRDYSISAVAGYYLQASESNRWQFLTGDGDSWDILTSASAVQSNTWVHLVATLSYQPSNTLKRLWINGALTSEQVVTGYVANGVNPLRLAAGATEDQAADYFQGSLDDVQFYDLPLSSNEVNQLYNNGAGGLTQGDEIARYRMDESAVGGVSTSGFHQALAASTGETWTASAWALVPSTDALKGSNRAFVTLSYHNSSGTTLGGFTSTVLSSTSPTGQYIRLVARGAAPLNTVTARISTIFLQDTNGSGGTVYFDDAVLSTLVVLSTNSCPVMPSLLSMVSATDTCGSVTVTQVPPIGATLSTTNDFVTFLARDACGIASTCTLDLTVLDLTPPTFTACATPVTVACISAVSPPSTNGITATDNCGPVAVTFAGATTNSGTGCGASPLIITRTYQATDQAGNSTTCVQTITVRDTNAPTVSATPPGAINNPGFETTTPLFFGWNRFGTHNSVETVLPKTSLRHAKIYGEFNGGDNYTGFYQDRTARSGQVWRASAFLLTPTNDYLQGQNQVELKLEFLGPFGFLDTKVAPLFTSNMPRGVYLPFSVSGTAPADTTVARIVLVFGQKNDAGGSIYVDDTSLSMLFASTATNSCTATLPDLTQAYTFTDCGSSLTVTQSPVAGSSAAIGTNLVRIYVRDACGNVSTTSTTLAVLDATAPTIVSGPSDMSVASTNDIPPADTNSVVASDNCSVRVIMFPTNAYDVVVSTNPTVVVRRTYAAVDSGTNYAYHVQYFTVSNSVPTAPTNVAVVAMSVGTNLVVRSLGTNSWGVSAEYTTNLPIQPQIWLPMTPVTNSFAGGTNVTSFNPPVTSTAPVIIRIRQYYP